MTRGTPESSLHASEVRKMLRCRHFCDGKQILRDAAAGGISLPFVELCLALRADYRTRNTQTMVQVKCGLMGQCPRWLNTFSKTLFMIWRCFHVRSLPRAKRTTETSLAKSRAARRVLSSGGMAQSHLPSLEKRAEDMTLQRWEELGHTQHAMWADNMFSRQFLTNPMRSNVSADLSVIMVVPTRRRLPVFVGHKHIADVRLSVNSTATPVQQSVPNLLQGIRFTLRNIKREFLRIPLDIVRPVLKPLRWKPLIVSESRSGTHAELF